MLISMEGLSAKLQRVWINYYLHYSGEGLRTKKADY